MELSHDEQNQLPDVQHAALDLETLAEIVLEIMRRELLLEDERIGK